MSPPERLQAAKALFYVLLHQAEVPPAVAPTAPGSDSDSGMGSPAEEVVAETAVKEDNLPGTTAHGETQRKCCLVPKVLCATEQHECSASTSSSLYSLEGDKSLETKFGLSPPGFCSKVVEGDLWSWCQLRGTGTI